MTAILEPWSHQLRNDTKMSPQLKRFLLFIVTSIVYGCYTVIVDNKFKRNTLHEQPVCVCVCVTSSNPNFNRLYN